MNSGSMIWSDVAAPARTQAQELRSLDLGQLVARLWSASMGRQNTDKYKYINKCVNPRPEQSGGGSSNSQLN